MSASVASATLLSDAPPLDALSLFPERQQRAILALARGVNRGATAKLVNVDCRTIYRWSLNPSFAAARASVAAWLREKELDALVETLSVSGIIERSVSEIIERRSLRS